MAPIIYPAATDLATSWDKHFRTLMRRRPVIWAVRGAGTIGGIAAEVVQGIVDRLIAKLEVHLLHGRPIVIIYDGDKDQRAWPDVGTIVGMLLDHFASTGHVATGEAIFMAAQSDEHASESGLDVQNANGLPYDTWVFPQVLYPDKHDLFAQSPTLFGELYEQVYVGALGMMSVRQLVDYLNKVPAGGRIKVTIIRAPINKTLDKVFERQLVEATDPAKRQQVAAKIQQRQHLYGPLWSVLGDFDPSLLQSIVRPDADSHELMVNQKRHDEAEINNLPRSR